MVARARESWAAERRLEACGPEAAGAARMGKGGPDRSETRRLPIDREPRTRRDPAGVPLGIDLPGLDGRDLRQVQDVDHIHARARHLHAAELVGREVAERVRGGRCGQDQQRGRRNKEGEPLHDAYLLGHGRPQEGEVGVRVQRAVEPAARLGGVAEAALDHAPMEELERIVGAEAKRAARVAEAFAAAAVALQRPGHPVCCIDARRARVCLPGPSERVVEPAAVVEVEDGRLELRADAVGRLDPLGRFHELVRPAGLASFAGRPQGVALPDDVLRQRQAVDDAAEEGRGLPVIPTRGRHPRETRLGVDVPGQCRARLGVGASGSPEAASVEGDVPELHEGGRAVLADRDVEREREPDCFRRGARPSCDFARVGDTTVGADARRELRHLVVGGEGLSVSPEVE